jgi:nicotinamide-nucleotide amidase
MKAIVITIGDEILIGQIVDTNSAWLGETLRSRGIELIKIITVGDVLKDIVNAMSKAFEIAPLVIMTGGLGPTKDDITKKGICEYFSVDMKFDENTFNRISRLFERRGRSMTPLHKEQCFMPNTAVLLRNTMGTAPGMWIEKDGKTLLSMPGVPYEMKAIMTEEGLKKIDEIFKPEKTLINSTIRTVGDGEARIAGNINDLVEDFPDGMSIAYLPGLGQVRLRITHTGIDKSKIENELNIHVNKVVDRLGDLVYTLENKTLEQILGELCEMKKLKFATAESCTGGFLAHKITSIAGSSAYFSGAIVSYSNELKQKLLGVQKETLDKYGAVSKETVLEMHKGLLKTTGTDFGISISGVAGPGGGSKEKPVGTIHFAWGDNKKCHHDELLFGKDRLKNIELASVHALNLLRKYVLRQ